MVLIAAVGIVDILVTIIVSYRFIFRLRDSIPVIKNVIVCKRIPNR